METEEGKKIERARGKKRLKAIYTKQFRTFPKKTKKREESKKKKVEST